MLVRSVIWRRKEHKPSFQTFAQVNNKSVLKSWSLFRFKSFISKQCEYMNINLKTAKTNGIITKHEAVSMVLY